MLLLRRKIPPLGTLSAFFSADFFQKPSDDEVTSLATPEVTAKTFFSWSCAQRVESFFHNCFFLSKIALTTFKLNSLLYNECNQRPFSLFCTKLTF